jgi:hypothetical protein
MNTRSLDEKVALIQISKELFSNWRVRFLLFIGSFTIAMFLAWLAYANYNHVPINELWSGYILFAIILFPSGLPFSSGNIAAIYWLVYIAIIVAGIWVKNAIRSRILFFILLLMLILNIAGCAAPPKVEITIF